jgi:riboflavin kinase/FMN adenylyltransferase
MLSASSLNELAAAGIERVAVAIGVFDGVHRGHQRILAALCETAERCSAVPVVVTFQPHPRALLSGHDEPPQLMTRDQQRRVLAELGVQALVVLPFTRELAALEAHRFVERFLVRTGVRVCGVCVGRRWRFGAGGTGTAQVLEQEGARHGFRVCSVPEFLWYGKPASSTRIRRAIMEGNLRKAARMLGRPHTVDGTVSHGRGLGGDLFGCATANLQTAGVLLPPPGVYAATGVDLSGEVGSSPLPGVAYVGRAPTVTRELGEEEPGADFVEFHLFDFSGDLYGRHMAVGFVERLRGDRVFASFETLRIQIRADCSRARDVLMG